MVRGCALIDSRLDTAKICSDGRVHVDHAQLPAVFGGEKTFSHGLGQNRKSSMRAYVFRFAPESGHRAMQSACPFRAKSGRWGNRSPSRRSQAAEVSEGFEIDDHLSVRSPLLLNDRTSEACCSFAS